MGGNSNLMKNFYSSIFLILMPMSLIWHEDQEDRTIKVIEGNGWKFQFDEKLPFELKKGDEFFIPQGYLHRVIKGHDKLTIKIIKE